MANEESVVEIGYLEKNDSQRLESRYFPSKVGGKPAWLDLKNISIDLCCRTCREPCIFLCQLYAPADEEEAYHRTVYVFVCRNPECCLTNKADNFKVFRCQLPRTNDYYVVEEPDDGSEWHPESNAERFGPLCLVCGCSAPHRCGKCKSAPYCSKEHQKLHWKAGHHTGCGSENNRNQARLNVLFPEYEIVTEAEIIDVEKCENKSERSDQDRIQEYRDLVKEGKGGTLQHLPLEAMEQLSVAKEDKYLRNYKSKLNLCPDQVIRYDKGGQPLWVAKPNLTQLDIPPCEFCQGPRQFEFQILSTMLSYLDVDSLEKSLDWGTLLVYTCTSNCNKGPAYKEEFLWKQDIL